MDIEITNFLQSLSGGEDGLSFRAHGRRNHIRYGSCVSYRQRNHIFCHQSNDEIQQACRGRSLLSVLVGRGNRRGISSLSACSSIVTSLSFAALGQSSWGGPCWRGDQPAARRPAASRSAAALSVFSQGKPSSSRPK